MENPVCLAQIIQTSSSLSNKKPPRISYVHCEITAASREEQQGMGHLGKLQRRCCLKYSLLPAQSHDAR